MLMRHVPQNKQFLRHVPHYLLRETEATIDIALKSANDELATS